MTVVSLSSTWKNENISNPTWIASEREIAMNLMIIFLNEPYFRFRYLRV